MGITFTGKIENNTSFEPVPAGEYEVFMTCEKKLKNDKSDTFINCVFTIRKDVPGQKYGGRMVFDGIYKSKTTGEYLKNKLDGIFSTIKDFKADFDDYDEVIQYINGTNMIVTIDIEKADPNVENAKDRNVIKFLSYKPSKVSPATNEEKEGLITPSNNVKQSADDISADDLPF